MVTIRLATTDDALQIAALGMKFIDKLLLDSRPDVQQVTSSVAAVLSQPRGVGFVYEPEPGNIRGFLLGMCVPIWFDSFDWSAIELAWWIDPEARGGSSAMRLVKTFEQWAVNQNVNRVVLSDIEFYDKHHPAGVLIERLGYKLHERAFVKVL